MLNTETIEENSNIRLHILGLPHTITREEYSHCAFTGKILRFAPMMRSRGFEVYHYGVETSMSGANNNIDILSFKEWEDLKIKSLRFLNKNAAEITNMTDDEILEKINTSSEFVGNLANVETPLYREFNRRLRKELKKNYRNTITDIVCLPFGRGHEDAIKNLNMTVVESGIGYPDSYKNYRIFESYAHMHSTLAINKKQGQYYWFVAPNYFDINEFKFSPKPEKIKIGFFGRICDVKGVGIVVEIAKMFPNVEFVLCGQGNPTPYLKEQNIVYKLPIHGAERSDYLGSLTALIAPTKFVEPFCGVSVEAQLCGTPVITIDYGALAENVENFKTGLRCHTLADFCYGIQMSIDNKFDREYIRKRAEKMYDMYEIAKNYEYIFKSILDVHNGKNGWYSDVTHIKNKPLDVYH